ncbi:ribonuclease D, partial [Escherichia coli]
HYTIYCRNIHSKIFRSRTGRAQSGFGKLQIQQQAVQMNLFELNAKCARHHDE